MFDESFKRNIYVGLKEEGKDKQKSYFRRFNPRGCSSRGNIQLWVPPTEQPDAGNDEARCAFEIHFHPFIATQRMTQ